MKTLLPLPDEISIKDKIRHTLEETRVVLPGTQALLGFQLVAVFNSFFQTLPPSLKDLHLLSLGYVCISIIILLSSVSYHRIVENGLDTERLHRYGSTMLLLGMTFLLLGMVIDIYIVGLLITNSALIGLFATVIILFFALFMWFLYPFLKRRTDSSKE